MKITFLGGGNMASALIGGLLNNGFPPDEIAVIEIGEEGRTRLEKSLRIKCYAAPGEAALDCDALVLAVKPHQMREACASFKLFLKQPLIVSVAAGLRLADISRWLGGYERLVRTMPNTPALIGAGVTGLFAPPCIGEAERLGVERVMRAVGSTLWVADEAQLDAVTAISGSGPAYVFLFMESLQQAAIELGFTPRQARQLALETTMGAARLAVHSDEPVDVLRERVTSKGGTTEAAVHVLLERDFKESIAAAARAAQARGIELGEWLGRD